MWSKRGRPASPVAVGLRRDQSGLLAAAGRGRRFFHSFTLRLSFYYASAFVISAALLFALTFFLNTAAELMRQRLREKFKLV